MHKATATFKTETPGKYIAQLCKHFAHKIEVEYDETKGKAAMPTGPANFEARDGVLYIEVSAEDPQKLPQAKYIIEDHLVRFAFREGLKGLHWEF